MHLDSSRNGTLTLTPVSKPHPSHASTLLCVPRQGAGVPSLVEALAARLEFASVVDVDTEVRAALATLAEWMRTGNFERVAIAQWLADVHLDVQPW
jgi:hypothetical protein